MRSLNNKVAAVLGILGIVILLSAGSCEDTTPTNKAESDIRRGSYAQLAKAQPAHRMTYSPSRETINFWIDTWNEPDKLSYVYLIASNGQLIGYYVFKGLPVSYCAALTPTWDYEGTPEDGSDVKNQRVPAPGIDGVYYSGGQCLAYYGKDATTGAYIEYTVGAGISALLYDQPLPRQDVEPLGFTTIEEVR